MHKKKWPYVILNNERIAN